MALFNSLVSRSPCARSGPAPPLQISLVFDAKREKVDERIARPRERGVAQCLGFAHEGWDQRDGRALAPLGAAQGVVVARFDGDLDGCERALEESIARPQAVSAAIVTGLAVEPREDASLLAVAAAKHQVHLAKAVVVARLVGDLDVARVEQLLGAGGPLELHLRVHRRGSR